MTGTPAGIGTGLRALVVTVSDRVAAGTRQDAGGDGLAARLREMGFDVDRALTADERPAIEALLTDAAPRHALILTTGGTGLTPRDVTPQATLVVIDYQVPGISELIRSEGGRHTANSYLSRAVAGVIGRCLVVNVPGSLGGAMDSLTAIEPLLGHALETLAGPFEHRGNT